MVAKDFESSYALFSPRMKRQIPIAKIQAMIEGNNYVLFEGYKSLSVEQLNINAVANTNPDLPQGTVAKVTGKIIYEGGIEGSFNATLEKVDGKWKLDGMYITVPPNKFNPSSENKSRPEDLSRLALLSISSITAYGFVTIGR
jgi:hypothetical protein